MTTPTALAEQPPERHARAGVAPVGAADPLRRRLLGSAAAAAALWPGRRALAQAPAVAAPFTRRLPLPPLVHGLPQADGSLGYALRMGAGVTELVAGLRTPTWGYNGSVLGPALRIPRARPVSIELHNGLNQPATTHWHGAHVPGDQDGGPQSFIEPGQSLRYHFRLDQPGATLWYHPHTDCLTGPQVWAGLAGLLLVDDGVDRRLGLPHRWGVDDLPLVLQDRRIGADGRLQYMNAEADRMGMKGDRFLVNGCEQPYVDVPGQWVRLRLLNGSNARIYNIAFADSRPFHVIASDAGLLPRPVPLRSLLMVPAERYEILLDCRGLQGRTLTLRSDSGDVVPTLSMVPLLADRYDRGAFDLLQLRVGAPTAQPARLPPRLVEIEALRSVAPARRFSMQDMASDPRPSPMAAQCSQAAGPGGMSTGLHGMDMFSINHAFMDIWVINQEVRRGATEIWQVRNDAQMTHPFHFHGTSFQIVDRGGLPLPEQERGWKDVVMVRPGETVRVIARFDQPAGKDAPFMYHCHILEHEDNGMMGQFTVT